MILMVSAVKKLACKSKSKSNYIIRKVVASKRTRKIEYLFVDNGFWFNSATYVVSVNDIDSVQLEEKRLTLSITDQELKAKSERYKLDPALPNFDLNEEDPYMYYWPGFDGVYGLNSKNDFRGDRWCIDNTEDFYLDGVDGFVAWLEGVLIDTVDWSIKDLVVESGKWRYRQFKVVPYSWVTQVKNEDLKIEVHMKKEMLKEGPKFIPTKAINKGQDRMYDYFGTERRSAS